MAASRDIEKRTLEFAVRIVRLAGAMPRTGAAAVLSRQLVRAGTSVGANVEEAQHSPTKKDFAWRMNVARAEARESLYWLRLIAKSETMKPQRLAALTDEANELVSILTTIVRRTRSKESKSTNGRAHSRF